MDTISMLLTGWIIFVFCALAFLKYLYLRFVKSKNEDVVQDSNSGTVSGSASASITEDTVVAAAPTLNGSARGASGTKVVETLTGPKVVQSNRPQRPLRRRRVSKDSSAFDSSFDYSSNNVIGDGLAVNSSTCSGPDADIVEYVNNCHDWLFGSQQRSLDEIKESFIDALNRSLRDSEKKNELSISVVNISIEDKIRLSNIFAECVKSNTVKITSDCKVQMKGDITVQSKELGIKRCEFFVDHLNGRISSLVESKNKLATVKLDGWPEICMAISSISPSKGSTALDTKLTEAIADRITAALRNTVVEVELDRLQNFPQVPEITAAQVDDQKKYLLVKVVKATDLGMQKGCQEPYIVIELDDPAQKFQTSVQEKQNPTWNENFVFNVIPGVGEMIFEAHDRAGGKFLGCNIISIDEIGSENTRVLPLRSRRMEAAENISGDIEIQLTFLDETEFKSREITEKVSPNGNLIKTTRIVYTKPPDANSGAFTENVIKEFERNVVPNAEKSTLIIHAVQRDPLPCSNSTPPLSRPIVKTSTSKSEDGSGLSGQYGDDHRGRRRTRRGDIFTSLRRRLSKTRSHSVVTGEPKSGDEEKESVSDKEDIFKRSVSADRHSLLSQQARLNIGGLGSARSSVSELSGISGHSTTTYVHENSTLVIECMENRIRKYYLVPPHLAENGKWKKRGKKLHIYNDHTFVAKHIPSGKMCEICTVRLPFALGKQGYQCRDCKMICHKECHVRAPSYCPKTTVYDIELGTTKSLDQTSTFSAVFSSLFCGKRESEANLTNKDSMNKTSEQIIANLNNSLNGTGRKKKKLSTFRRVTRLGKISEENLNGGGKINGNAPATHLDCSDVEEEKEDGFLNKSQQAFSNEPTESTVSIPNTNEDEENTMWEEKAIPLHPKENNVAFVTVTT